MVLHIENLTKPLYRLFPKDLISFSSFFMIVMKIADFQLPEVLHLGIMESDNEQRIGFEILKKIRSLELPLKLDEITEGRGNCFPLAILSQCQRPDIFQKLSDSLQLLVHQQDPNILRNEIYRFMTHSKHPRIQEYKRRYEEVISRIDQRNWCEYWKTMVRNNEWVDYIFVQSTAWFLCSDILIVTTTSTDSHPYITISGNLTDENKPCQGNPLIIGCKSHVHYQSLLPLKMGSENRQVEADLPADSIRLKISTAASSKQNDKFGANEIWTDDHNQTLDLESREHFPDLSPPKGKTKWLSRKKVKKSNPVQNKNVVQQLENRKTDVIKTFEDPKNINKETEKTHFIFKNGNEILDFEFESEKRVRCSSCQIAYKNILRHLQQSSCKISDIKLFSQRFQEFKKNKFANKLREKQNEWKMKSLAKKREENSQKLKDDHNRRQSKYLSKQREEDPEKVKEDQNKWKRKYINKKRDEDLEKVKEDQNKWKGKSLTKQREEDPEKLKEGQNKWKRKSRFKKREEDFQKVKDDQNKWKKLSRNKRKIEDPKGLANL